MIMSKQRRMKRPLKEKKNNRAFQLCKFVTVQHLESLFEAC